jgi:hypothetical protein
VDTDVSEEPTVTIFSPEWAQRIVIYGEWERNEEGATMVYLRVLNSL